MTHFKVFFTDAKGANPGSILLEARTPEMARQRFAMAECFEGCRITKVKLSRADRSSLDPA